MRQPSSPPPPAHEVANKSNSSEPETMVSASSVSSPTSSWQLIQTLRNQWKQQKQQVVRSQNALWSEKQRDMSRRFAQTSQKLLAIIQFHEQNSKLLESQIRQLEATVQQLTLHPPVCNCSLMSGASRPKSEVAIQTDSEPVVAILTRDAQTQVEGKAYLHPDPDQDHTSIVVNQSDSVPKGTSSTPEVYKSNSTTRTTTTTTTEKQSLLERKKNSENYPVNLSAHELGHKHACADATQVQATLQNLYEQLERMKLSKEHTPSLTSTPIPRETTSVPNSTPTSMVISLPSANGLRIPQNSRSNHASLPPAPLLSSSLSRVSSYHQSLESTDFKRNVLRRLGITSVNETDPHHKPSTTTSVLSVPLMKPKRMEDPVVRTHAKCVQLDETAKPTILVETLQSENRLLHERLQRHHQLLESVLETKLNEQSVESTNKSAPNASKNLRQPGKDEHDELDRPMSSISSPTAFSRVA